MNPTYKLCIVWGMDKRSICDLKNKKVTSNKVKWVKQGVRTLDYGERLII